MSLAIAFDRCDVFVSIGCSNHMLCRWFAKTLFQFKSTRYGTVRVGNSVTWMNSVGAHRETLDFDFFGRNDDASFE